MPGKHISKAQVARHGFVVRTKVAMEVGHEIQREAMRTNTSVDEVARQILTWWWEDVKKEQATLKKPTP